MGIAYACITPHGAEIIPQLAGDNLEKFSETRHGMETIATGIKDHKINTIVIATPHNLRLRHHIGIVITEFTEGTLRANSGSVQIRYTCNRALAEEILGEAERAKLPVVGVNYGTADGEASCMSMDWGTLIPLWFLGNKPRKPQVVIITPSREIPLENLVKLGNVIAKAAEKLRIRTAFVASADQAHTHNKKGPYGFHPDAAKFDKLIVDAVKENSLKGLLRLDQKLVENAKPDSLWQMAILMGVLDQVPMKGKFISYQAPTYFGMLCAAYTPD